MTVSLRSGTASGAGVVAVCVVLMATYGAFAAVGNDVSSAPAIFVMHAAAVVMSVLTKFCITTAAVAGTAVSRTMPSATRRTVRTRRRFSVFGWVAFMVRSFPLGFGAGGIWQDKVRQG